MGILGRVRRKVSGGLRKVKDGVKAIHEESRYPGRPASYQAADSPFWRDEQAPSAPSAGGPAGGDAREAPHEAAPAPADDLPKPTDSTDRDGEPFWFLQGSEDLEGWEQTNPSEEWRKRHGVDDGEGGAS